MLVASENYQPKAVPKRKCLPHLKKSPIKKKKKEKEKQLVFYYNIAKLCNYIYSITKGEDQRKRGKIPRRSRRKKRIVNKIYCAASKRFKQDSRLWKKEREREGGRQKRKKQGIRLGTGKEGKVSKIKVETGKTKSSGGRRKGRRCIHII